MNNNRFPPSFGRSPLSLSTTKHARQHGQTRRGRLRAENDFFVWEKCGVGGRGGRELWRHGWRARVREGERRSPFLPRPSPDYVANTLSPPSPFFLYNTVVQVMLLWPTLRSPHGSLVYTYTARSPLYRALSANMGWIFTGSPREGNFQSPS